MSDYEVGYGKPPPWMKFQKGKCPNPKGRPKKRALTDIEILRALINAPMNYPFGKKMKQITRAEGMIRNHGTAALRGSIADAAALLNILEQSDKFGDINPTVIRMSAAQLQL